MDGVGGDDISQLSVCFVVDGEKIETYRSIVPAMALRRRGIKADVVPFQQMSQARISQWNVFVSRMLMGPEKVSQQLTSILKMMGATLVYDADDDPFAHFGAQRYDPLAWAKESHVSTVSTPALRQKVPDAVVLPNCIDFSLWDYRPKEKPLTIGLVGGATHLADWRQVKEPLENLQEKHGIRLVIGGYFPGYLRHLDVEFIPWQKYSDYPDVIREIDILLCPLNNDEFNLYKSGVKALEGMSQGCCVIASDHPVYRRVVNHKHNGLLVKDGWEKTISRVIEDNRLRKRLCDNALKWVRKNRDMDVLIQDWIRTYAEAGRVRL